MSTRDSRQHLSQSALHINDKLNSRVSSGSNSDKKGKGGHGAHRKLKNASSPRHLLYQVLLSPIKKKVTHHKHELMVSST
jgi:hypothetical protein